MSRPAVSLIVPFSGGSDSADRLLERLAAVRLGAEDEVIVVDNSPVPSIGATPTRFRLIRDSGEPTSYYARNTAAQAARRAWLLFLDADCIPDRDLIDAYFATPPREESGMVAGAITGDPEQTAFLARWARWRLILDQSHGQRHPYRPFASTANLLVRRAAFLDAGGFAEGILSGGDADFCWRAQELGWALEQRPAASVLHTHRERPGALLRQAIRYGRGQAWLERRHPALPKPQGRARGILQAGAASVYHLASGRAERAGFRAADALFLVGLTVSRSLPNRPGPPRWSRGRTTFVAGVYPSPAGEPPFPGRIEAARRPLRTCAAEVRGLEVAYLEDDSLVDRMAWWIRLAIDRHRADRRHFRGRGGRKAVLERLSVGPAAGRVRRAGGGVRVLDEAGRLIAEELVPITGLDAEPATSRAD